MPIYRKARKARERGKKKGETQKGIKIGGGGKETARGGERNPKEKLDYNHTELLKKR